MRDIGIKQGSALAALLASLLAVCGCTPSVAPKKVPFTKIFSGDPFTTRLQFEDGTDTQYEFGTRIELSGGSARLIGADQADDDDLATGFGGGVALGVALNSPGLKLGALAGCDGRVADCAGAGELSSLWTPRYANLAGYWPLDGAIGTFASGTTIKAKVGSDGTVGGSGGSFINARVAQGISTGGTAVVTSGPFSAQTTNVTMAAWVYMTAASVTNGFILLNGNGNNGGYGLYIGNGSGGNGNKICVLNSGSQWNTLSASPSLAQNTWTHLAVTRDTSTWTLFVNGVAVTTGTGNPGVTTDPGLIGAGFPGYIDDAAFWNVPLTAAEIDTIYRTQAATRSGGFISRVMDSNSVIASWTTLDWRSALPSGKALPDSVASSAQSESTADYAALQDSSLMTGIAALWHLDEIAGTTGAGSIADTSGKSRALTPGGDISFGGSGRFERAAVFGGNNSTLSVTASTPLLTTASTLSLWVRLNSRGTGDSQPMLAKSAGFNFAIDGATGMLEFYSGGAWRKAASGSLSLKEWHHVALVQASTQTLLYLDGVLVHTSSLMPDAAATFLELGGRSDALSAPYTLNGQMDEVSIWSRPLTSIEIKSLYARGAGRLKFQVRSCSTSDCGTGIWKGPDGSANSWFSESYNRATQSASPAGVVLATAPRMTLFNFTSPPSNNRYFQYRVVLESWTADPVAMPEVRSVVIGPSRYATTRPTIQIHDPIEYNKLTSIIEKLGAGGCPGGIRYSISYDKSFWLYFDGTEWTLSDGSVFATNDIASLNSGLVQLTSIEKMPIYLRAHLGSNGSQRCELDELVIQGER